MIEILFRIKEYILANSLTVSIILVVLFIFIKTRKGNNSKHKKNIKAASKAIKKIKKIETPPKIFNYLRKINPFIFEEICLTAISNNGHSITRNKKYTGDGGIDGKAKINGVLVLIQAKRYTNHINNKHIIEFSKICHEKKCKGIFIHTGKTGKKSREVIVNSDHVTLISGNDLILLLLTNNYQFNL